MSKSFYLIATLLLLMASCVVDEPDLSRYSGSAIDNVEEARNVEVNYTDSTYTVFILKAPLSRRVFKKNVVTEVFPEGIEVTFMITLGSPAVGSPPTTPYAIRPIE